MAKSLKAGVKVRGLKQLQRKLRSKFKIVINKTIRDRKTRQAVGDIIAQDIRDNFDNGVSILAKPFTRMMREFLEQFNSTHPDYRRNRINITFTGELLEDLASNVKADTVNLAFIVEHSNKKHGIYKNDGTFKAKTEKKTSAKTGKDRNVKVKISHRAISDRLIDMGYDYLKVSDMAEQKILELLRKQILDNIKREFGQ